MLADIGVRSFFVLWDGGESDAVALLQRVRHVTLAPLLTDAAAASANVPAADKARYDRFVAFRSHHWQWAGRPGNYELMVKQGFCVNEAIRAKKTASRAASGRPRALYHNLSDHWLFHLDVDEALLPHPGPRGALRLDSVLAGLPAAATSARFLNYEAVPESETIRSRLREVTLFKAHGSRVDARIWKTYSNALRPAGHPEWPVFLLFGNGKPAARLSTPALRQWGPHFFKGGDAPHLLTGRGVKATDAQPLLAGDDAHASFGTATEVAEAASAWLEVRECERLRLRPALC